MKFFASIIASIAATYISRGHSLCTAPDSFFDFGLPQTFVPFTGTLSLFGDDISAGEIEVTGSVDIEVAAVPTSGTSANVTFNSFDFFSLFFVYKDVLYEPFEKAFGNNHCKQCTFNSVMPPRQIKACPFQANLTLILEGDEAEAAGQAVKYLAKRIVDLYEIAHGKSEAAILQFNDGSNDITVDTSYTDNKTNSELRQIIDSITAFKGKDQNIPTALNMALDMISTEANPNNRNLVILLTDGFDGTNLNSAQVQLVADAIRARPNSELYVVASDGDVATLKAIAQCEPIGLCPYLFELSEVTSAAADRTIMEFNKMTCKPPNIKESLPSKDSVTLLTFAVDDNENPLTQNSLQSIAGNLIRSTAEEYNISQDKIQLLEAKTVPRDSNIPTSSSRRLQLLPTNEMFDSIGILQIGMLNEALPTDPQSLASSISDGLLSRESNITANLRKATPASVTLDNFEVRPLKNVINQPNSNSKNPISPNFAKNFNMRQTFADILSNNEFLNLGDSLSGKFPTPDILGNFF